MMREGAEQSVQQGVGQLCQSADSLPASLSTVVRLGEEEQEEGPH